MSFYRVFSLMSIVIATLTLFGAMDARAEEKAASTAVLETDEARQSYAIGIAFGEQLSQSIKQTGLKVDTASLFAAVDDVMNDRTPAMDEEGIKTAMEQLRTKMMEEMNSRGAKNLEVAKEFLANNAKVDGVVQLESGLQYKVITAGDGEKPGATDKVRVHYRGTLLDGTEFDSSYARNNPAEFQVNQVIPGWQEALQLMPVGAKYQLFIPPDLAYGEQGNQRIPGNSLLLFDVELLAIVK